MVAFGNESNARVTHQISRTRTQQVANRLERRICVNEFANFCYVENMKLSAAAARTKYGTEH